MASNTTSPKNLESFIETQLKEDLRTYEQSLNKINHQMSEYVILKNTVETIQENMSDGFKTQVPIGGNFHMQARVDDTRTIYVNIGLATFVEFSLEEAIRFVEMKIRILEKHADVVRDEANKTKATIKLGLICIGEQGKLYGDIHRKD